MSGLISAAVCVLLKENKILLLKRNKEPYKNLWSLPGGKIELEEHLSFTAERELLEETGIKAKFVEHLGIVSEHLLLEGKKTFHFILHLCLLKAEDYIPLTQSEGELLWADVKTLHELERTIVSSDIPIIKKIIINREKNYVNCVIEKVGENHLLRKFT
ncbi:NUDIX domain-containing protein [Candidatus Woesearchaeota archaeon]|nr:NUDIX domain-containing protein [Candidatus Woesearchaeota archaeon]